MRWLRIVLAIAVGGAVFWWGISFALLNAERMPLHLVFWRLPQASLATWVVAGFVVGVVLGLLASSWIVIKLNARQLKTKRELNRRERELDKARAVSG